MNYGNALSCPGSQHQSAFFILCNSLPRFLFAILGLLAARVLPAAEQFSDDSPATVVDDFKALHDQTVIKSSVWLDTEWDQFEHGAEKAKWTLGGWWVWHICDQQDWAVRLKVPFVYDRSDQASGHADIGGLGDIEVATATAFRLSKTLRTGGGLELHADTASNPALGDNVWRLHTLWAVADDITAWLTLTPTVEYNHSVTEEHSVPPQRYLELSLPAIFILPYDWSMFSRYKVKIDFENRNHWTHTVNLGVAKRLPKVPLILNATLEKDCDGGKKKFQVNFIMTYYFETGHVPE
jgi:hypothetical protein